MSEARLSASGVARRERMLGELQAAMRRRVRVRRAVRASSAVGGVCALAVAVWLLNPGAGTTLPRGGGGNVVAVDPAIPAGLPDAVEAPVPAVMRVAVVTTSTQGWRSTLPANHLRSACWS